MFRAYVEPLNSFPFLDQISHKMEAHTNGRLLKEAINSWWFVIVGTLHAYNHPTETIYSSMCDHFQRINLWWPSVQI